MEDALRRLERFQEELKERKKQQELEAKYAAYQNLEVGPHNNVTIDPNRAVTRQLIKDSTCVPFNEYQCRLLDLERHLTDLANRELHPSMWSRCQDCNTFGNAFPFDRRCGNCNSLHLVRYYSEGVILRYLEDLLAKG